MSTTRPMLSRRGWALVGGAWLAWGLLWAASDLLRTLMRGQPVPGPASFLPPLVTAVAWAAATPAILAAGRRWPVEGSRWARHLLYNAGAAAVVIFVVATAYQAALDWVATTPASTPLPARAVSAFPLWYVIDSPLYWAVVLIDYGIRQYAAARDRALHASRLETQLAQARLSGLKMQLQPHFLFNALHTIGALVRTGESRDAVRVVAGLGDLLRAMLDDGERQEVTLRQELDFVRSYLDIEQIRFSDRLRVVFAVDDEALDASVPHLVLQPLVENALRHGIAPSARGGCVIVSARRVNGTLLLGVRDNGCGLNPAKDGARQGLGLRNIRNRLAELYGGESALVVEPAQSGGTDARITLPYRPAVPED